MPATVSTEVQDGEGSGIARIGEGAEAGKFVGETLLYERDPEVGTVPHAASTKATAKAPNLTHVQTFALRQWFLRSRLSG